MSKGDRNKSNVNVGPHLSIRDVRREGLCSKVPLYFGEHFNALDHFATGAAFNLKK